MTPVPVRTLVRVIPIQLALYLTAVGILGASGIVAASSLVSVSDLNLVVLLLGLLAVLTSTSTITIPNTAISLNADTSLLLALIVVGAGPEAILISAFNMVVATIAAGIRKKRAFVLNISAGIIGGWCAWLAYEQAALIVPEPVPALVAGFGMFLANSAVIAGTFLAEKKALPPKEWRDGLKVTAIGYLASGSIAALLGGLTFWQLVAAAPVPWAIWQLYRSYEAHKSEQVARVRDREQLFLPTLEALVAAIEARDERTHGHNRRIRSLALGLAQEMNIKDESLLTAVGYGALLHDVGKIAIPDALLRAKRRLTVEELERVRKHVVIGAELIRHVPFPPGVLEVVRQHHERWDGCGYPERLVGEQISVPARMVAVCEAYDDQRTGGGWREPISHEQALLNIAKESGTAFEPTIVEAFLAWQRKKPLEADAVPLPWTSAGEAIRESSREQAQLHELAYRDELTGIGNPRALRAALEIACEKGPVGVIVMDLDGFKGVNDHFGHHIGDLALQLVGQALASLEGPNLSAFRNGGDEFIAVLSDATESEVVRHGQEIQTCLESLRIPLSRKDYIPVRVSVGAVCLAGSSPTELLQAADVKMYAVKHQRKEMCPRGAKPEICTTGTPAPH